MKHYLSHNAECEIPSNLLFVSTASTKIKTGKHTIALDLERWNARHVRLNGMELHSEVNYPGYAADAFWLLVEKVQTARKPLWIVCYNAIHTMTQLELWEQLDRDNLAVMAGGKFKTPRWFISRTPYRGILACDGLPFIIKATSPNGTVWIIDLLNFWSDSIEGLATMVNYTHDNANHFHDELDRPELFERERSEIIRKVFLRLLLAWKRADMGNWKPTAASLSMTSFRHLVCDARQPKVKGLERFNILIDKDHPAIPLEREAYRGGRVEAFYIGYIGPCVPMDTLSHPSLHMRPEGPVYLLDIRSMYPRIMSEMLYPCERVGKPHTENVNDTRLLMRTHEAVAEVLINSWQDTYPLTYEGRQIHACGRFWTVLCGDELRRALANKHVESMGLTQWYRTAPLFHEWAKLLMDMRTQCTLQGDKGMSDLCKLLANSLHGKFAQKPQRWELDPETPVRRRWGRWYEVDADTKKSESFRAIAGIVQRMTDGTESEHTFPAISACIAANAREWLRTLILLCPPKSVLYVATDSLLVTREGYLALTSRENQRIVGKDRLALKDQGEYAEVKGQGYYTIEDREVISGPFANAIDTGSGTYTTQLWSQAASIIAHGPNAMITASETAFVEPESRPKGVIHEDGWITPLQLVPTPEVFQLTPREQRKYYASLGTVE